MEEYGEKYYRIYLGGRGVIGDFLIREVSPGCDPLAPENVLVFAASVWVAGVGPNQRIEIIKRYSRSPPLEA